MGDDAHARDTGNDRQPTDPGQDRDRTAQDRDDRAEAHDQASAARETEPTLGTSVLRSAGESMASLTQAPFLTVRVP